MLNILFTLFQQHSIRKMFILKLMTVSYAYTGSIKNTCVSVLEKDCKQIETGQKLSVSHQIFAFVSNFMCC